MAVFDAKALRNLGGKWRKEKAKVGRFEKKDRPRPNVTGRHTLRHLPPPLAIVPPSAEAARALCSLLFLGWSIFSLIKALSIENQEG